MREPSNLFCGDNVKQSTLFLPFLLLAMQAGPVQGQYGPQNGEWRHVWGDAGSTSYQPLDGLTRDNIDNLQIAWRWSAENFGPRPETIFRVTPLMVNGVLYTSAGSRRSVAAIDAATGETLWTWRMDEGERGSGGPRVSSGRGVAYAESANGEGRIYTITPGYNLVALDAATGRQVESFGNGGVVDLKASLSGWWGKPVDPVESDIGSSSPPIVSHGVIVVGAAHLAGLRPVSRSNVPGYIQAFDQETGEPKWVFHTVPKEGELGYETWENGSADYTGNAGAWPPFSVDEERGIVYVPTEAATSDYYGGHRLGDDLFSTSLLALDVQTGERIWYHQIIHHDIYDWDNPTAPILVDINVDGETVPAVVQLTKQAFAYVFNRETGEPVWPFEDYETPKSDVPGERVAEFQQIPTKPPAYDRQGFTMDDLIDFTPEIHAQAEEAIANLRLGPVFSSGSLADAPDGTQGTLTLPGTTGGANWEGGAVDPETGMLYVGSQTNPAVLALVAGPETSDMAYMVGRFGAPRVQGLPIVKPPWGRITAIDLNRGEIAWQVPNADTPENVLNNPLLQGVEVPRTGVMTRSVLLVTRNFLFAGEGTGGSPAFRAHDKQTGDILWEMDLPAAATGVPMGYELDGQPYIVVAVAQGGATPELVALTVSNDGGRGGGRGGGPGGFGGGRGGGGGQ